MSGSTSAAPRAPLFEKIAGTWTGAGTVQVTGGQPERIRCRADYSPSGPTQLHLALRCASDAFNLQIESDITQQGDRITGRFTETSVGASGTVSGTANADQLRVAVSGTGVSAQLTLLVRGETQGVTIAAQGSVAASAAVTLRRN